MEMTFDIYKEKLLSYLNQQKRQEEIDIETNKHLSPQEKEELGLRIRNAKVVEIEGSRYKLHAETNNSKFRPGDRVTLISGYPVHYLNAVILENFFNDVIIETSADLDLEDVYDIEVTEVVMLQAIISLIQSIEEGGPGSFFLEELAGISEPYDGVGAIPLRKVTTIPEHLNEEQREICEYALERPTIACIQGPPGTGKTDVLATIAHTFSSQGKEVLVLSLTHQAVNNALNKIKKVSSAHIVKVGQELKAEDISDGIIKVEKYSDYIKMRKDDRSQNPDGADIIGMTVHSSISNLGLRKSGFNPYIVLVDEASQIPVTLAATIGAIGCGSILFIGDDKQMPPIFHEKLQNRKLSVSVFQHLCSLYPDFKRRLSVTYRMNDVITNVVSKNFYEPYGEKLTASDFSKDRRLGLCSDSNNHAVKSVFNDPSPFTICNATADNTWEDENPEEGVFIASLVQEAFELNMDMKDVAVITPYRRQVKNIRASIADRMGEDFEMPLIDTVERLQGQDVDLIIISFCASDPVFFIKNKDFLLNQNRMNVMISRAKKKVVLVGSKIILDNLNLKQ